MITLIPLKPSNVNSSRRHKQISICLNLSQASSCFYVSAIPQYKFFENTVGIGKITRDQHILLYPLCCLPYLRTFCHFYQIQNCRMQALSVWKSIILWFGKGSVDPVTETIDRAVDSAEQDKSHQHVCEV